jgi:hypothetical protein
MDSFESESLYGAKEHLRLERDHVSIRNPKRRTEHKIPYWNIWPSYTIREVRRENTLPKILVWSIVPGITAYCAITIGWFFWLVTAVLLLPVLFLWRRWHSPYEKEIVFLEDDNGDVAFTIGYPKAKEKQAVAFVSTLCERLEASSKQRGNDKRAPSG